MMLSGGNPKVFSYSSNGSHQLVTGSMILLLLVIIAEVMAIQFKSGVFAWFRSFSLSHQ
jgi:hypothetical protein